jgi:hypothetical protein
MIKGKQDIITNSYSNFETTIKILQSDVFTKITDWLKKNIGNTDGKKTLTKLNKELKNLINSKVFEAPLKNFLKDFDQVETISKKMLESENDLDLKDFDITPEKELAIDEIISGLSNDAMIEANLRLPLKKMLYRYVTTGLPYDKAEKELKDFILTDPERLGFAERYTKVLTQESLSRFDGTINQKVATEYKLDGFRFVGSNIKTTEPQCRAMTTGSGELEIFEVNGKYRVEDLPEMIRIMKKYRSTHKNLDVTNFFILRWHWGCRHQAVPTRLNEKDKKAFPLVKEIEYVKKRAKESGDQVDKVGKEYAKMLNGTVTPINYKSFDSIKRKLIDELIPKGDGIKDLKDSVRNTVLIKNKDLEKAKEFLENDPLFSSKNGGRFKVQNGPEYYGYRGIITNYTTQNGIIAETQFNTPGMIYAKVSKREALFLMSEEQYDNILKTTGIEGGKGHDYYEKIRVLAAKKDNGNISKNELSELDDTIKESVDYYSNFYKF